MIQHTCIFSYFLFLTIFHVSQIEYLKSLGNPLFHIASLKLFFLNLKFEISIFPKAQYICLANQNINLLPNSNLKLYFILFFPFVNSWGKPSNNISSYL